MSEEGKNYILNIKEELFKLYYEILSEIKNEKVKIDEEQYQENLRSTKVETIIHYIKESIGVLVAKEIRQYEEFLNVKRLKENSEKSSNDQTRLIVQYEQTIKKLENDLRRLLREKFSSRLQREALEMRMEGYMEMEESFEEMKEKLKYEDGQFLDNDRKDNEIIILRSENSNLKNVIQKLEQDASKFQEEKENSQLLIMKQKAKIEKLIKKLTKYEKMHKENLTPNLVSTPSASNLNSVSNIPVTTKWVLNENMNISERRKSTKDTYESFTEKRTKIVRRQKVLPRNSNHNYSTSNYENYTSNSNIKRTYERSMKDFSLKKDRSHSKNSSITMSIDKCDKRSFSKILPSGLVPNTKFPVNAGSKGKTFLNSITKKRNNSKILHSMKNSFREML